MTTSFTTEGLGIITGAGGDVDDVVRKLAWERAHPGGMAGREQAGQLGYTARWPDGSVAATAYASLGVLMGRLDQAEAAGGCPVHGALVTVTAAALTGQAGVGLTGHPTQGPRSE